MFCMMTGPYFASAGDDIKLWDSSKFQIVKQYNFHKGNVKDLAWSSDNSVSLLPKYKKQLHIVNNFFADRLLFL